jgi:hypothetical protein
MISVLNNDTDDVISIERHNTYVWYGTCQSGKKIERNTFYYVCMISVLNNDTDDVIST